MASNLNDKAVSTEDLCDKATQQATIQGVLRLEAILNTLVENKVESLKNQNSNGIPASPKKFLRYLKIKPSKTRKGSLQIEDELGKGTKRYKERVRKKQFRRQVLKQETSVSVSSPESQPYHCRTKSYEVSSVSDDERNRCIIEAAPYDSEIITVASCHSLPEKSSDICYCAREPRRHTVKTHFNEDYISLKIDGFEDVETDAIIAEESARKARRKRRRRRRKKMKKRLMMNPHLVDAFPEEHFKPLNDDELPPRAKWTIVATACLLLFMCLLLVGITLRMAPIIDEIVREENEKLIKSISGNVSTTSVH